MQGGILRFLLAITRLGEANRFLAITPQSWKAGLERVEAARKGNKLVMRVRDNAADS